MGLWVFKPIFQFTGCCKNNIIYCQNNIVSLNYGQRSLCFIKVQLAEPFSFKIRPSYEFETPDVRNKVEMENRVRKGGRKPKRGEEGRKGVAIVFRFLYVINLKTYSGQK